MTPEEEARALALAHEAISLESDDGVVFHIARLTVALAERVEALTVDLREACDMADENAQAATRAEVERERYRLALEAIACLDDATANMHLAQSGSYAAFDEPGSVRIARAALTSAREAPNA